MNLFGERIKTPEVLMGRCPEAEYPQPPSYGPFEMSYNNETYDIEVSIPYIIAVAEVDFNAKTLERNNQ